MPFKCPETLGNKGLSGIFGKYHPADIARMVILSILRCILPSKERNDFDL